MLFRLLRVRLLRYFWGVSRDIAEDLAQETLAAFFACNGRLRSEDALHCYVYRIAARTLGRELRRRDRQAELDELAMVPETFDSIDVDHLDLVRVLRTSRSKFAATVVDYYIGGRCAKELAADHCVPESTIRSRLRSGLGQLRRELAAS